MYKKSQDFLNVDYDIDIAAKQMVSNVIQQPRLYANSLQHP